MLIVNFTARNRERIFHILTRVFNSIKYSFDHTWDHSFFINIFNIWSLHCISFSWWSLPISKYSTIKTFKHWVNNWPSSSVINFLLRWSHAKHFIKRERVRCTKTFRLHGFCTWKTHNSSFIVFNFDTQLTRSSFFFFDKRSNSYHNVYIWRCSWWTRILYACFWHSLLR